MARTGRPTTYSKEYIAKVDEYLAARQDETYQVVAYEGERSTGFTQKVRVKLPTYEGFAQFINVPIRTMYEWRDAHPEFSQSLGKILIEQKRRLIDSGLSGDYNPTIAKLILSANHDMRDKADLTSDGKALPAPIYGGLSAEADAITPNTDKKV